MVAYLIGLLKLGRTQRSEEIYVLREVKLQLHAKNELSILSGSALKVCEVVGGSSLARAKANNTS